MFRFTVSSPAAITAIVLLLSCSQPQAQDSPAAGEWGRRASLLEAVSEQAVAELGGKIYVIAGITNDRGTVAAVQVYNSATDSWTLTAPLPVAVNHNMAASANGKLYVFGGQTAGARGSSSFVDSVFEFDPGTGHWTPRAPLPRARSAGATAVVDGKIYVAGGRPPRGHDFAVYDPVKDSWTSLPDLPTQRNHLAAVAIDGKVYVAGGRLGPGFSSEVSDVLEIFDPVSGQWSEGSGMPVARGGINGVVANDCLHVFGGEGNQNTPSGMFSDHDVYNPVINSWTRLSPMPIPVHGVTGGGFLNGLLYLPGGATGQGGSGRSDLLQIYRPAMTCR